MAVFHTGTQPFRRCGPRCSTITSSTSAAISATSKLPPIRCAITAGPASPPSTFRALPSVTTRPSLGLFVVILQGTAIVAVALGADAYLRRLASIPPGVRDR